MPNPREAIFDVLKAKAEREKEERRVQREGKTQAEAFAEWNRLNQRAKNGAK